MDENFFLKSRTVTIANYITGGIFIALYINLSFHSRLASDDFYYISLLNDFGSWKGMLFQYYQWSGRWAAHFMACFLLKFRDSILFMPAINILTLLVLFLSLRKFIKFIGAKIYSELSEVSLNSLSLALITCFFYSTYDIGETWFWYIIIITYLWSIIAFIVLINCIFSTSNPSINFLGIIISSTIIGGSSESFAVIFIFILTIILLYRIFKIRKKFSDPVSLRLFAALLVLIVSFSFSVLAPGTAVRYSLLPHPSVMEKLWIAAKAFIKYFVRFLPEKIIYLILFSFPWFFAGSLSKIKMQHLDFAKRILKLTIVFIVLISILFIPTTFVLSETGPGRALSIVSFATTFYFAILFFLLGHQFNMSRKIKRLLFIGCFIFSISIITKTFISQSRIGNHFANEYDKRMSIIDLAKKNNYQGCLILDKLPEHGFLYWEELSPDTSYFVNKHLKAGLELPFTLCVQ